MTGYRSGRADALVELAPYFSASERLSIFREALDAIRDLWHDNQRASALAAYAKKLPEELLLEAVFAAEKLTDGDDRARALAAIVELMPIPQAIDSLPKFMDCLELCSRPGLLDALPSYFRIISAVDGNVGLLEIRRAIIDAAWFP